MNENEEQIRNILIEKYGTLKIIYDFFNRSIKLCWKSYIENT